MKIKNKTKQKGNKIKKNKIEKKKLYVSSRAPQMCFREMKSIEFVIGLQENKIFIKEK